MRAMILAAGLGTRMQPLSGLRAKPALPVRDLPVIAHLLALLARHDVREVIVNVHHLPGTIVEAIERFTPPGVRVELSHEPRPLGTGGGIRRARAFLAGSDPALVLAGDMLLDVDLTEVVAAHRRTRARCTLLLRRDPRAGQFGTIGIDARGRVRRIARRLDLGGEWDHGVFLGVRVLSPGVFASLPDVTEDTEFEDLSDWLGPALRAGDESIRGRVLEPETVVWEPVGTPAEYLAANLAPPPLSYLRDLTAHAPAATVHAGGISARVVARGDRSATVVVGAGARIGAGASLERCVVWAGERVPDGFSGRGGVFAGGRFYACEEQAGPR